MGEAVLGGIYGVNLTQKDTSAEHTLGMKIHTSYGKAYRYVQAGATMVIGSGVRRKIDESAEPWVVEYTTETTDDLFGVLQIAVTDNDYFWCQVEGPVDAVNVATGVVATDPLVPSSTDGRLEKQSGSILVAAKAIALDNESSNAAQVDLRCG